MRVQTPGACTMMVDEQIQSYRIRLRLEHVRSHVVVFKIVLSIDSIQLIYIKYYLYFFILVII